jgi:hypothetical protein
MLRLSHAERVAVRMNLQIRRISLLTSFSKILEIILSRLNQHICDYNIIASEQSDVNPQLQKPPMHYSVKY